MNRNFPLHSSVHVDKRDADSRGTDICVMSAISCLAEATLTSVQEIWENPNPSEFDWVRQCLNEWARHGDIEPGSYCWGEETISVEAQQ